MSRKINSLWLFFIAAILAGCLAPILDLTIIPAHPGKNAPSDTAYQQAIPVIAIAIDPIRLTWLHDYPEEHDQNEEQPITLEYFAPGGQAQVKLKAGIKIYEDQTGLYGPKKSYQISFSQAYGGSLEYPLFEDTPVQSFDKLVLRAVNNETSPALLNVGPSSTQTYFIKFIGDQVLRNLYRDMGQPAAHGRWVLLYLNGQFRGLYNLTESIDPSYFESCSAKEVEAEASSPLSKDQIKAEILNQAAIVRPFIQMEIDRWASDLSLDLFDQNIQDALRLVDQQEEITLPHLARILTNCQ